MVKKHWTLWNKGDTICISCHKRISGKPSLTCQEIRHLKCYKRNCKSIKRNREEAQYQALVKYSGKDPPECVLCGFKIIDALQLDHPKGDGGTFRRNHPYQSGKSFALWLRKRGYPKGLRTLCANCQCIERQRKGYNGGNRKNESPTILQR